MRTYVPMQARYAIEPADRPGIQVFEAATLEECAASLAAQPDPEAFVVYAHRPHAYTRALNPAERIQLAAALRDG